jgi:spermidine synthase
VADEPDVLERLITPRGELVLRRRGEHFEVISNGTFLMDTRNGESERLLVTAALARHHRPATMLIGGLGVGFSVAEALADERVERAVVVEIEPAIVDWHRRHLGAYSAGTLHDPRTTIVIDDLAHHLRATPDRYDLICLDIDNGPQWTVTTDNAALYDDIGTALIASRLAPQGILSVWSAARSPSYESILRRHFADLVVHEVAVPRGRPDVVIVASAPVGTNRP